MALQRSLPAATPSSCAVPSLRRPSARLTALRRRHVVTTSALSQKEFAKICAEELPELSQDQVAKAVKAVLNTIVKEVAKGEKISFMGFGSFEPKARSARSMRNPRDGSVIDVAASRYPQFSAGSTFKNAVKGVDTSAAPNSASLPASNSSKQE